MLILVLYALSNQKKKIKITLIISLIQNIDNDDSQKKSAHEEVIAFCILCKFCIIYCYKNTAFTKDLEIYKNSSKNPPQFVKETPILL